MSRPITLQITGDYNDRDINRAIRDLNRLKRDTGVMSGQMAGFQKSFMGAFTGIGAAAGGALAAMVGFQAVTQFFKDSMQAAIEDEKSVRSLAQAMTNLNLEGQLPGVEAGIDKLSRLYGIADDQLRPAFQKLATATESVTQSQKLLAVALDISAGTGKDLETVTTALVKAAGGQTTALGRLGVGLDSALLKSKDMDAITAELARKFGGQAAAAADTYAGKLARLTVATDEFKEKIGYELLSSLDQVAQAMGPAGGTQADIDNVAKAFGDLVRGIGVVITFFARLTGAVGGPGGTTSALRFMTDALVNATPAIAFASWLGRNLGVDLGAAAAGAAATGTATAGATPGVRGLSGAIEVLDIKARSAAAAFDILYGNASKFANVGKESGISRADRAERVAAGLALDPAELMANNFRSASGGSSAAVEKITQAQARILAAANKKLVDYNNANAPFGEAAIAAAESFAASFDYGTGPFAEKAKGLVDAALTAVRSKVTEAQQVGKEITDGLTGQLSLAEALETAKQTGGSIVDAFVAQGEKIKQFAENIKKLTAAGLSQEAVKEIVAAGYQRGGEIADAMISGNIAENVRRANEVYTSVNAVAKQTGDQAAAIFGQSGIKMALDMLTALIEVLSGKKGKAWKDLQDTMSALAASLSRTITLTYVTVGNPGGGGGGGVASDGWLTWDGNPVSADVAAAGAQAAAAMAAGTGLFDPNSPLFPVMGTGGPIAANQPAIVGDLGPELFVPSSAGRIIPNDQLGGGNTYNITVQAGVGDPREIGRQVVEAIKSFERASGPVFVNA